MTQVNTPFPSPPPYYFLSVQEIKQRKTALKARLGTLRRNLQVKSTLYRTKRTPENKEGFDLADQQLRETLRDIQALEVALHAKQSR